jgi:hypothetical protein
MLKTGGFAELAGAGRIVTGLRFLNPCVADPDSKVAALSQVWVSDGRRLL